ncbi:MAG: hypothetical protein KAJ51_04505 [Thermoplasmata archaeon]|nr:hypothetical protein [Thermoplasmata archaeon]
MHKDSAASSGTLGTGVVTVLVFEWFVEVLAVVVEVEDIVVMVVGFGAVVIALVEGADRWVGS